ncbi:AraC family transcriptional regulator [Roseomonas sp. NAR14]|uniref:AraC family transcriptional regulator n=1 Tax=Roseomonas acroporae TaxID=2937791 RepID=A0A9X2C036_9PROT|nr:AraC family transcriptional regulator [Roseomonas acroporae]MCK8787725.1 AraC family transcriptional regulator [Roseomonas acroporae]
MRTDIATHGSTMVADAYRNLGGSAATASSHPAGRKAVSWPVPAAGLAPWQQRRVQDFVEAHLHERILVVEMAARVRLSRSFFSRAFGCTFGATPHAYLMLRRLDRAMALMGGTNAPLAEVAASCGLSDQAHLSRLFRRHLAMTPREWRRVASAGKPDTTGQVIGRTTLHAAAPVVMNGRGTANSAPQKSCFAA